MKEEMLINIISSIGYTHGVLEAIIEKGCEYPITNKLLKEEVERINRLVEEIIKEADKNERK
jgi:hypothetical protein